jgi:hypothetical protein
MSKTLDVSKFKPGQTLVCTVEKLPKASDASDTIARLMRLDPETKKALRRAQRMRRQRMIVYNRGNRDWVSREHPAKVIRVKTGESFSLPFSFDLANDLASVGAYLTVKSK